MCEGWLSIGSPHTSDKPRVAATRPWPQYMKGKVENCVALHWVVYLIDPFPTVLVFSSRWLDTYTNTTEAGLFVGGLFDTI